MDLPFLVLVLTLVAFGLVMLCSASSAVALYRRGDAWAYVRPQLLYAAMGLVAMWTASRVDYHIYHKLAWPLLALSLVLLTAVVLFATGIAGFSHVVDSLSAIKYARVRTVRDELDKNLSGLKTPDSTSTAPGIDEGLSTTTPQEDETTWEWPTEPAANSVSNVPKAASSASRSASSVSSAPQAGSGSVREPSALQGASSPASSSAAPASTQPVSGRVLNGYSGDELVYNKTLGDWRTHNGIDYACAKDAAVQSPTAGTVVLAGSDGSWGPTVAIKDSAGRVWRLCGVASPAVKEGETVSAGQTLGKVGSVSCECAEESHIHLEVKQDDSYLDPAKLMQ